MQDLWWLVGVLLALLLAALVLQSVRAYRRKAAAARARSRAALNQLLFEADQLEQRARRERGELPPEDDSPTE